MEIKKYSLWTKIKLFMFDPRFFIRSFLVMHRIKVIKRQQTHTQKVMDKVNRAIGNNEILYPGKQNVNIASPNLGKPIPEISESEMYMCVSINAMNLMVLHGIVSKSEPELIERVAKIRTSERIMYVGSVADIKNAIINDNETYEQTKLTIARMEKSRWN